jgi:hypothetical protein
MSSFGITPDAISTVISNTGFIKKTGLNKWWIIGLFALKVFAGIVYGWFYQQPAYFATSDTWHFFELSKGETDWLLHDPSAFFKDIFMYGYERSGNLFVGENSYWNDLKSNVIIKLLAICNVLTLKNYYANIVLFNFLFFFGPIAFYRVIKKKINTDKIILIAFVFCIPSFLFWCSGMHKDGLIFTGIALIVFYFGKWLREKRVLISSVLICMACIFLVFTLRNFVLLLLLPALLTWWLCERVRSKKIIIIVGVYGLCLAIFFIAPYINSSLNFPAYIVSKQNEFKALGGNSQIQLPVLEPSFAGFVRFFPLAADIAFFRPHPTETANIAYLPSIAENVIIYLLLYN